MGRRKKRADTALFRPKCYPVVVPTEDEQRAFEAMAEHKNHRNVGSWLCDLGRLYVQFYFDRNGLPEPLLPWIEAADADAYSGGLES